VVLVFHGTISTNMGHTSFPGFRPQHTPLVGSLGAPRPGSFDLYVGEKTACGLCGFVHHSLYDRKTRRVRDLSSGDMRIYLELVV
jgi:hypothetical protein